MYWLFAPGHAQRTWIVSLWCIGVIAGIALVPAGVWFSDVISVILGCLLLVFAVKRSRISLVLLCISGFLIGNWHASNVAEQLGRYSAVIGDSVTLIGRVDGDAIESRRGFVEFNLSGGKLLGTNSNLPGKISVSTNQEIELRRGDVVQVTGKIRDGFGSIQAAISFAEVTRIKDSEDKAIEVRDEFAAGIRESIQEPQASLGIGFLLGQRSALPEDLDDQMRLVGLTHIVVASGYNLTILVRLSRRLLMKISKFQALAGSLLLISGFIAITGFSPSMTRAGFVASLSLLVWYYGRSIHPVVLLLVAIAITALINPLYLWGDMGWYLSFLAFAGVLIIAPILMKIMYKNSQPSTVGQVFAETMSAQLMATPFILYVFGTFSVLALPANLLVVPLIPLVMLLTFIAGIIGVFAPWAALIFGFLPQIILNYMTTVTSWLASYSWASTEMTIPLWGVLVCYAVIIGVLVYVWPRYKKQISEYNITQ